MKGRVECTDQCTKKENKGYNGKKVDGKYTCTKAEGHACSPKQDDPELKAAMNALFPPPMGECNKKPYSMSTCLRASAPPTCFQKQFACMDLAEESTCTANEDCAWAKADKSSKKNGCDESGKVTETEVPAVDAWCGYNWFKKRDGEKKEEEKEKEQPCQTICDKKDEYKFMKCHGDTAGNFKSVGIAPTTTSTTTTTTTTTNKSFAERSQSGCALLYVFAVVAAFACRRTF